MDKEMNKFVRWALANAHQITSTSQDCDVELDFLKDAIGEAKIVSLGECQHYTDVFNSFHAKVFRYLVKHAGFTAFAFETPLADAKLVYEYVLGKDILPETVFEKGMSPMFGGWLETRELIEWMRAYNMHEKPIRPLRFYGVDIGSAAYGGNSSYPAIQNAIEFLEKIDKEYAHSFNDLLQMAEQYDLFGYKELSKEKQQFFTCETLRLYNYLTYMGPVYHENNDEYAWALQCAYNSVYCARWFSVNAEQGMEDFSDNVRELCMADNLKWVLDQEGADGRIVYHSHNQHVQRGSQEGANIPTGVYLDSLLSREQTFVIASTSCYSMRPNEEPEEGSLELALSQVPLQYFLLDLGESAKDSKAYSWLNRRMKERVNTNYSQSNPIQSYDMVFFTNQPLQLTKMCYHPYSVLKKPIDTKILKSYTGIYKLERTWLPTPVNDFITVELQGDHLVTHGLYGMDGEISKNSTTAEHFPVYASKLLPVSETKFFWENYFGALEFLPNRDGNTKRLEFEYYFFGGDKIGATKVE